MARPSRSTRAPVSTSRAPDPPLDAVAPHNQNGWQPSASLDALKRRAQIIARIRDFFAHREVLEVETPILSGAATVDPNLHSFTVGSLAPGDNGAPRYLHTSPEFAMKRLLAAGSGAIYQICRVFRAGEAGRLHNPEFTMLEWYRVGYSYRELMDEVTDLVGIAFQEYRRFEPSEKISYRDAFLRHTGLDPHNTSASELATCARRRGLAVSGLAEDDLDGWRDLLLTHLVEPHLGRARPTFVYDYPASQAALARIRPGDPPLAERFELYVDGVELANGFSELADAQEQRRRFEVDREVRAERGLALLPEDRHLLAALAHELPDCSGVALGLDRLVMLATGAKALADVLSFPFERA